MSSVEQPFYRVRLTDDNDQPARTTESLVGSLAARLAVLHFISGADAVGALIAGFAALGRDIGQTAQGARLRQAIEAGRPGRNGIALWDELHIGEWVSSMPPSPVLNQLRNDLALLLSDDLDTVLEQMPIPNPVVGEEGAQEIKPVSCVDYLLGMWAFSTEFIRAIELIVNPTSGVSSEVISAAHFIEEHNQALLR